MDTSYLKENSVQNPLALLSITAWHLLLHERTNVSHLTTDIFSHPPFWFVHSSSTFLEFFPNILNNSNILLKKKCLKRLPWVIWSVILRRYSRLINCSFQIRYNMFLQNLFALILPCSLTRGPQPAVEIMPNTITSSTKFNAAFSALWRILFLRTVSNEPSPITTEQVKLWLIAEMNTISLFFGSYDVFSDKFQSAHFVIFRNVRLYRSYSTVQIYFIKSYILMPKLALALLEIAVAVANRSFLIHYQSTCFPLQLSSLACQVVSWLYITQFLQVFLKYYE